MTVLIGQGLGQMQAWGGLPIRMEFVTEFTYVELVRFFGLPLTMILFVVFAWPFVSPTESVIKFSARTGAIALLAVSFWNPYIWGTAGMVPLGLLAGVTLRAKQTKFN